MLSKFRALFYHETLVNSIHQSTQQGEKKRNKEWGLKSEPKKKKEELKVGCKRHKNKSCSRAPTNHKKHIWKREGWETWKSNDPTRALFFFRLTQCNPPWTCSGLSIIPVIQIVILLLAERLFATHIPSFIDATIACKFSQITDSCHLASPTCYAHAAPPVFTWLSTPCYHWLGSRKSGKIKSK